MSTIYCADNEYEALDVATQIIETLSKANFEIKNWRQIPKSAWIFSDLIVTRHWELT